MRPRPATVAIVAIYAAVMVCTNHLFTNLDDESTIVSVAGHPILSTLQLFFSGAGQHEHPPVSDLLLHLWLVTTRYSFPLLRVFANIFYIAGSLCLAAAARRLAGNSAYFTALALAFLWPFSFQYARITGWYSFCFFLISWLTLAYLQILDDTNPLRWFAFTCAALLLVWSNYFGVVVLLLLLVDFICLHRRLAVQRIRPLLAVSALVAASFLPLIRVASEDLAQNAAPTASPLEWKARAAELAFSVFSIFASVAVAPWFWPLSIPVLLATAVLIVSVWRSPGRRWFLYFAASIALLGLGGYLNVKRVLFLLPWLFLATSVAASSSNPRFRQSASIALVVLVLAGWAGIISGNHYSTTNLYEPWSNVATLVAGDARRGATIVSENTSFLFYLDYRLGLESDTASAQDAYLGEQIYRLHGNAVLEPDEWQSWIGKISGKVVLVNGSAVQEHVQAENAFNKVLHARCTTLGEYRAAPDPAAAWKKRFAKDAPILPYRTQVIWYDCPTLGSEPRKSEPPG